MTIHKITEFTIKYFFGKLNKKRMYSEFKISDSNIEAVIP